MLSTFPLLKEGINILNIQYRSFLTSARFEYDSIVRNNHARIISRIGFVTQDMKDFENDVANDIENRAIEINDRGAQCISDAQIALTVAAENAGSVIVYAARDWSEGLFFMNDEFVSPIFEEIEMATSLFEIEILALLVYFNSVSQMDNIVSIMTFEIFLFDMLFEIFVTEIYVDFIIFEILSAEKNELIFPLLNAGFVDFRFTGNLIRTSLSNCYA